MSFKVTIRPSGHKFDVEVSESILDGALRAGYVLPYNCRNGVCGTCKNRVLSGRVDYGDVSPATLTEDDKANGMALFCQAKALEDVEIEAEEIDAVHDVPIRILPCRVAAMEKLAHDVMGLKLTLPQGQRLQFLAGQYIDFLLKDGRRRSFSLANAPHNDEVLELQIRQVPDGFFTTHVFQKMKQKDLLRIRGPLGTFFLREDSERSIIMVAGGTGLAPMKAILEHMFHIGMERPVQLYWGVRAKRDLYLLALLDEWQEKYANFLFVPVLSEPAEKDQWQGRTGWVHDVVLADHDELSDVDMYASGPPPMINALKGVVFDHGLTKDRFFYDSFEFAVEPGEMAD
ncbi:MAG: CDP-6-deoxy-delta-3,4-glucoseen reductase [Acidiferrobacterales bacterium]